MTVEFQTVDGGEVASVALPAGSLQREQWGEKIHCFHVKFLSLQDRPHIHLQIRNQVSTAPLNPISCAFIWASLVAQLVKNPPAMMDLGLIPELGSSPTEGSVNPLQYSCLENPMDR